VGLPEGETRKIAVWGKEKEGKVLTQIPGGGPLEKRLSKKREYKQVPTGASERGEGGLYVEEEDRRRTTKGGGPPTARGRRAKVDEY